MLTILHQDIDFEDHPVYVSGSSYKNCTFRRCTLIVKELGSLGSFENCRFEDCVWYLNTMVSDRASWDQFEQHVAPSIRLTLPAAAP